MKKLTMLGIIGGAMLLTAIDSADAQVIGFGLYSGYGYPAYSYGGYGYGYPAYSYGGYYRPGGYLGYRSARRVAIHRARWR